LTRGYPDWFKPHRDSDYPIPSVESLVQGGHTNTAVNQLKTVYEDTLSEDWDAFVRRIVIVLSNGANEPVTRYYSDIEILAGTESGTTFLDENLFGLSSTPSLDDNSWRFGRTYFLNDARVPAGENYIASLRYSTIAIGTTVTFYTMYVLTTSEA
jgi:hypothetical protein